MENKLKNRKPVVLSAIQPTSVPTLGNYLGALKNWKTMSEDYDCVFSVADLHALTARPEPAKLRAQTLETYALLLAAGLDPRKNIVFIQSRVSAHSELAWILNCYTQFGEASRMIQFKEKSQKRPDDVNVGLFAYPVLMAADILLYRADFVPVGADQKQHLEIARDIAVRFNALRGEVFALPEPFIGGAGAKIASLQDPTQKMSKSDPNPKASVSLLDPPEAVMKKIKSAVTDGGSKVERAEGKYGINNLMTIYSCCTGLDADAIEREFENKGYGEFKVRVAEAVIEELRPIRENYGRLMEDKEYLMKTAAEGTVKAARIANGTLLEVKKKTGLLLD